MNAKIFFVATDLWTLRFSLLPLMMNAKIFFVDTDDKG